MLFFSYKDEDVRPACVMPDASSFYGLWDQFKLGLPITLASFMDWTTFEIMVFTAGRLSVIEQAA